MNNIHIEQIKTATIIDSSLQISKKDIDNLIVECTQNEIADAVAVQYTDDNLGKFIKLLLNSESYQDVDECNRISNGIVVLQDIIKKVSGLKRSEKSILTAALHTLQDIQEEYKNIYRD